MRGCLFAFPGHIRNSILPSSRENPPAKLISRAHTGHNDDQERHIELLLPAGDGTRKVRQERGRLVDAMVPRDHIRHSDIDICHGDQGGGRSAEEQ